MSGTICNYAVDVANIANPESLITIAGAAALVPKGRTEPILVPFPDDRTQLFYGQCAEVKDFELDIDLCQNGFHYEVAIETGSDCKGSKFISAMYKICYVTVSTIIRYNHVIGERIRQISHRMNPLIPKSRSIFSKTDVDCTLVNEGTKCEDVYTMGYSMPDCIQDVRYDFSYSNQNGDEKDSVVFDIEKTNVYNALNSSYTYAEINGTVIQGMNDYMENIATGGEVSFSYILPSVNVCENIPNATLNVVAQPNYIDVRRRNDYTACAGFSSYEYITGETYSFAPISSPPSMDSSLSPTFSGLLPQTGAPTLIPSFVPTLRHPSKGGKKKPKRGKKAGKARKVPRKL